jgi:hypothetical protein
MDIYDASQATNDNFINYGDSITSTAMGQETASGTPSIGDLIHAQLPNRFPVAENGGTGYLTSGDGVDNIDKWLSMLAAGTLEKASACKAAAPSDLQVVS